MPNGSRNDPYRAYNFRVEIGGITVAGFSEASGLTFETDTVDYRVGSAQELSVTKLSGLRKFNNLTLKKGITDNTELWEWYKSVLNGTPERKEGSIILLDEDRTEVHRWDFKGAFICKWEGPSFNATSNDVGIESIEICPERVELQ